VEIIIIQIISKCVHQSSASGVAVKSVSSVSNFYKSQITQTLPKHLFASSVKLLVPSTEIFLQVFVLINMSFSSDSESDPGLTTSMSMSMQLTSRPTELLISKRNGSGSADVVREDHDSPLQLQPFLGLPLSPSVELHAPICEDQGLLPDSCEDDSEDSSQDGSDSEETVAVVTPVTTSVPPVSTSDLPANLRLSPATGIPGAEDVPAEDRPSHVSLLGGKYLLFSNPVNPNAPPQQQQPPCQTKNILKCINVETREHFFCKVSIFQFHGYINS